MAKQPQSCAFRTSIGGQALIDGILMRGPEKQAIVVRDQGGNLVEKVEELRLIKDRHPILGWPLIRGTVNFLSSMVNGVKALMYSADFYPEEETTEPSKFEQWLDRTFSNKKLEGLIVGLSVLLGIGLSICKTIITAHHGTLSGRNHADGAEFCFTLPKAEALASEK